MADLPSNTLASPAEREKPVVLCIDDDTEVLSALRRVLRDEHYKVVTATTVAQALSVLRHDRVRIVISDFAMPTMSGVEFLAEVRQRWPWIGRMILTAYPQNVSSEPGHGAGIDVLAPKPWKDDTLKKAVRDLHDRLERERFRV